MHKGDDLTTFIAPKVKKIRSLNLPEPIGPPRPVAGHLYLLLHLKHYFRQKLQVSMRFVHYGKESFFEWCLSTQNLLSVSDEQQVTQYRLTPQWSPSLQATRHLYQEMPPPHYLRNYVQKDIQLNLHLELNYTLFLPRLISTSTSHPHRSPKLSLSWDVSTELYVHFSFLTYFHLAYSHHHHHHQ